MSKDPAQPSRPRQPVVVEDVTDPEEIAATLERLRRHKTTAMGQIGCWMVVDAPLPMLAQVIAELPADEQQEFLKELLDRLPADSLPGLGEALHRRLGLGAA